MSDTLKPVTLGDGNDIDVLVLLEESGDLDGLLEEAVGVLDLVGDRATVDLDLHEVGLLLLEASLADLGVGEDTDDSAVLADALELASGGLAAVLGVLLGVAGEGLLLRAVPVLVEATFDLIGEMVGPDSGESAEATGSLDVTNNTNDNHGGSLYNSDGLNNLTLVHFCSNYQQEIIHPTGDRNALDPARSRSRTMCVMPAL